jgi:hypothetical protein
LLPADVLRHCNVQAYAAFCDNRCVLRRSRRKQKESDSDPDYEGERSERSGRSARARAAAKRSTASNTARPSAPTQHQGFQSQHMQAQRMQVGWAPRLCTVPLLPASVLQRVRKEKVLIPRDMAGMQIRC